MSVNISNLKFVSNGCLIFGGPQANPPVSGGIGGSAFFNGTDTTLMTAGSTDWALGSDDFTIEWFQNQTAEASHPRVFSIGVYPSASVAVSIESASFYFWASGIQASADLSSSNFIGNWNHFAIVNFNGALTVYQNGSSIASGSFTGNITDSSTPLYIGSEANGDSFFGGNITNFRWSKGTARYTAPFTPTTVPFTVDGNTQLLMLETDSPHLLTDYTDNHSVTDVNSSATWSSSNPF